MSLETTIMMYNQVTPVLQSVVSGLDMLVAEAKKTEGATKNMINLEALESAQGLFQQAGTGIKQMTERAEEARRQHENYNKEVRKSPELLGNAIRMLKTFVATYASLRGIKAFVGAADEFANIKARLDMISGGAAQTLQLQDAIYQKAQESGAGYTAMVDNFTKLAMQAGNAFGNSNQTILEFSTLLNKQFAIAGTEGMAAESVMYNLTQALASGVLRGQDLNAILQNTPQIARMIEEEMNLATGSIRSAAEEGLVTSDIVVRAILNNKDKIDAAYGTMPKTFGRITTEIGNSFLMGLRPAFESFSQFLNAEQFQTFVANAQNTGSILGEIIGQTVNTAITGFNFIIEYGALIKPIVLSIATAYGIWILQTKILTAANIEMMKSLATNPYALAVVGIVAFTVALKEVLEYLGLAKDGADALNKAILAVSATVAVLTGAMIVLNGVTASNPIGLVLMFAASIIVFIVTLVKSLIERVGGLAVAWLIVQNVFISLWEKVQVGCAIMGSQSQIASAKMNIAFMTAFDAIQVGWNGLQMHISNGIQILMNNFKIMINDFISSLNGLLGLVGKTLPTLEVSTNEEIMAKNQAERDRKNAADTASTKAAQKQLEELKASNEKQIQDMRSQFSQNKMRREADIAIAKSKALDKKNAKDKVDNQVDIEKMLNSLQTGNGGELEKSLGNKGSKLDKIADNTKGIKDNTAWRNNDLTSLRDLMEQRAITSLSKDFKVEINNSFTGNVDNSIDEEAMAQNVSNKIARQLEMQFNAG